MKLRDLAARLECTLAGDGELEITRVRSIEDAGPGDLTFLTNPRYAAQLAETKASAIILAHDAPPVPLASLRARIPYLAFARALELFHDPRRPTAGVHPTAVIATNSTLGDGASVGACAVIGEDVAIGPRATIFPHVVIYPGADRFPMANGVEAMPLALLCAQLQQKA